jgi:hypothetical protein
MIMEEPDIMMVAQVAKTMMQMGIETVTMEEFDLMLMSVKVQGLRTIGKEERLQAEIQLANGINPMLKIAGVLL